MLRTDATINGKTERSSMKILEGIANSLIQQMVSIGDTSRALSQEEHYRCNMCGAANAGEMPNSEQIDFYGLLGPREAINSAPGKIIECELRYLWHPGR